MHCLSSALREFAEKRESLLRLYFLASSKEPSQSTKRFINFPVSLSINVFFHGCFVGQGLGRKRNFKCKDMNLKFKGKEALKIISNLVETIATRNRFKVV